MRCESLAHADETIFHSRAVTQASHKAESTLIPIGRAGALEFRLKEKLRPAERRAGGTIMKASKNGGPELVRPIGDAITDKPLDEVLDAVAEHSRILAWFNSSYPSSPRTTPRRVYGYDDPIFSEDGARPNTRAFICAVADVCFAPYAAGWWAVTASERADLRVDIRAATNLIWTWGTFDHFPLAFALSAARLHPTTGESMAFEPFTILYRKTLELHLADTERCARTAAVLSSLTMERLRLASPGRLGKTYLYEPVIGALYEHLDGFLPPGLTDDDEAFDVLARGAALLLRKVDSGEVDPADAIREFDALSSAVREIARENDG